MDQEELYNWMVDDITCYIEQTTTHDGLRWCKCGSDGREYNCTPIEYLSNSQIEDIRDEVWDDYEFEGYDEIDIDLFDEVFADVFASFVDENIG